MRQLLLLAMLCAPAWACSCSWLPSVKEAWLDAPLVFVGRIGKAEPDMTMGPGLRAPVRVIEAFLGVKNGEVVELFSLIGGCYDRFPENQTLLLYLYPAARPGAWLGTGVCSRSRSLDRAIDDLRFLRGLPDSASGNRVSGTVSLYEDDPVTGVSRRRDTSGVRVRAFGESGTYETKTDAEGFYEFRNLRPGIYEVAIDCPKRTVLRYPVVYGKDTSRFHGGRPLLPVTEESGNGVDFILASATRISGRVAGSAACHE